MSNANLQIRIHAEEEDCIHAECEVARSGRARMFSQGSGSYGQTEDCQGVGCCILENWQGVAFATR